MHTRLLKTKARATDFPALFAAVGLSLLLSSVLISCSSDAKAKDAPKPARPVPVSVAPAVTRTVPVELSTFGTAEAISTVSVKAQVTGTLTKVHFVKGQNLKKGDVLFTIDPRTYQAALDQAQANLARDLVLLASAKRQAVRTDDLFNKNAASETEHDTMRTAADALSASVHSDMAAVENAKLQLEFCTITCPLDGKAGNLLLNEGNLVKADDAPLVAINQISPIEVFFSIPQDSLGSVRERMAAGTLKVRAWLPSEASKPELGELIFVDNAVDNTSGTVRLGARFENRDERFWPGQYVMVSLTLSTIENAVLVPARAVETGRDGKYVYVVKPDKTVELRPVTVGARTGDMLVLQKGLSEGETVVTDGQLRLTAGAAVEVKAPAAAPAPATAPATQASRSAVSPEEAK